MSNDFCKQDTDKVLLVEGVNDCHVVMALCNAHNIPETFGIYECGSDDKVLKRLNALIIRPNPPIAIGIMLDVDKPTDNPSVGARLDSIKGKLKAYSYQLPKIPDRNGTIVIGYDDKPKLGFWLMPNNQEIGMLEDFCAELAEPEALKYAQKCVEQAVTRQITTFKKVHQSKAIIHTYLAWCDEPGNPLGQAIGKQSLSPHTDIAIRFTDWLNRLFT
jgi:hypothetical protein